MVLFLLGGRFSLFVVGCCSIARWDDFCSRCCRLLLPRALEKPERGTTTTDADGGGIYADACGVVVVMDPLLVTIIIVSS